jgi:ATP synthase protein I
MDKRIGNYSFIIGVILAVVLGILSLGAYGPWLSSVLVLLGLIVGFLNVTGKETKEFLLVAVVLIITAGMGGANATLGGVQYIGQYLSGIFTQILAFVVPATVVVALKDIWGLGQVS